MTEVGAKKYRYVSPYLNTPRRSLAEAERDRQADRSDPATAEPALDGKPPGNDAGKR